MNGHCGLEIWKKKLYLHAGKKMSLFFISTFLLSTGENLNIIYCLNFRELGIGIVPYSPLGRGFFSAGPQMVQTLAEGDARKVGGTPSPLYS